MSAEEGEVYVESWADLNVAELREELSARGLDVKGNKPALVARLEEADREADEAAGDGPDGSESDSPEPDEPDAEDDPAETAESSSDQPSPPAQPSVPSGAVFHAEFDIPDDYDGEEDWDLSWKLQARQEAIDAGHQVFPAAYSAQFKMFGSRDGRRTVVYQVPTVPQYGPMSSGLHLKMDPHGEALG